MFFLRCAFWLSVVYASMSWNDHRFAMPSLPAQALTVPQETSQALARRAASHAASACADRVTSCASEAVELAALIAASQEPQDSHEPVSKRRLRDAARHP